MLVAFTLPPSRLFLQGEMMPLSPMLTTGHYDPPTGSSYAVIKVIQNGQVAGWGWTETTATINLRLEYWVLAASYVNPVNLQTNFSFDNTGFPGGPPTTRAQFFAQLQGAWGSIPGVKTCSGPATAMSALPSTQMQAMKVGSESVMAMQIVHPPTTLQVEAGTLEIWSSQNSLVGWLYTDSSTGIESLVSVTNQVGPGLPLVLKPSGVQYQSPQDYFAAMTQFLTNHGPPQRYESIANQWFSGVHPS
jgi:hypothetical protein